MFEPISRRAALTNLALVIGGAILLPACDRQPGKASIALKKIDVNADQERFIADMAETIIPKTDTPGAKDLGLHLFVLKMVDDCFSPKDQQAFMAGLDKVSKEAAKRFNKPFSQCTGAQREALINELDQKNITAQKAKKPAVAGKRASDEPVDDMLTFYSIVKGETIFGYTYSKYFMTKQIIWELVPGRYNPNYPVSKFKEALKYG